MNVNCVSSVGFMANPNKNLIKNAAKNTTERRVTDKLTKEIAKNTTPEKVPGTVTETVKKAEKNYKPQNPLDSYLASRQQVNIKPVENPDVFYNPRNAVANDAVDPNAKVIDSFLKSRGQ